MSIRAHGRWTLSLKTTRYVLRYVATYSLSLSREREREREQRECLLSAVCCVDPSSSLSLSREEYLLNHQLNPSYQIHLLAESHCKGEILHLSFVRYFENRRKLKDVPPGEIGIFVLLSNLLDKHPDRECQWNQESIIVSACSIKTKQSNENREF